jgi:hypothetical protein
MNSLTKSSSDSLLAPLAILINQIGYSSVDLASGDPSDTLGLLPEPNQVVDHAGETLAYTVTLTNTGSADLANVVVYDGAGAILGQNAEIDGGESRSFIGRYNVAQADIDNGTIAIAARATDDNGDQVFATTSVPVLQLPGLSIAADFNTTSYDVRNDSKVDHSYQAINYTVTVTNTGNETLTGLQTADGHSLNHLDVGQSWTYTSKYHVTQSDIDSGGVSTASVPPTNGIANTFSVTDDQGDHASTTVTTPVVQDPKASVLLVSSDKTSVDHAGEVINFTVIEANTGNVTLDTTTTEKLNGVWTTLSTDTLLPSQAKLLHYSYTVTQADMDAGLSIGTMVEVKSPQAVFGDNSWKGVQVGLDQKATVNVENLESFDNGQTWYFHQMPGFATAANIQAAFKNATGSTPNVVGYTTAPNVGVGTQVLCAALVTNTGNVTEHQLTVRGFAFDSSDLAPGASMLSHVASGTAATSGTYTSSVSVNGNHTVTYGWNTLVPFALTSNTDAASYSVGDTAGAGIISLALNTPQQSSFVSSPSQAINDPWAAIDAMLAKVSSDLQGAAAQIQAATDYVHGLPPLPSLPFMQSQSAPTGSLSMSDLQAALNQLQSLGLPHG